eukprot:6198823-Pleurochrysis_carterae.AAC.10
MPQTSSLYLIPSTSYDTYRIGPDVGCPPRWAGMLTYGDAVPRSVRALRCTALLRVRTRAYHRARLHSSMAANDAGLSSTAESDVNSVRQVLIIVAMEQECMPLVDRFQLKKLKHPFLEGAPMVAWAGHVNELTLKVVWCGSDKRFGVNNVATTAAAVAVYGSVAALGTSDVVLSVGTAGGFSQRGARIGDAFISTKCVFHSRRIPDVIRGHFEEYGFGHFRSPPLSLLAQTAGLKLGVVSTSDSLDCSQIDMQLMMAEGAAVKEMEAAAVAWVCLQLRIPFFALKAITDVVDGTEATREEFESNLSLAAGVLQQKLALVLELLSQHPLDYWAGHSAQSAPSSQHVQSEQTLPAALATSLTAAAVVADASRQPIAVKATHRTLPSRSGGTLMDVALGMSLMLAGVGIGMAAMRWLPRSAVFRP